MSKTLKTGYADRETEKQLKALEERIAEVYRQAAEEETETIKKFYDSFAKEDAKKKAQVEKGKLTEEKYQRWRLEQLRDGKRYEAMRDKLADRMTRANEVAMAYVNDATPGIYSLNRNWTAYTIEQAAGNCDFTLFDEQTVKRLIKENPSLMPNYPEEKAVKRGIDLEYGKKQITASVTSSILQGKSIPSIAEDLQKRITDMSVTSAVRTARTATTGAQNAGRIDGYEAANKRGIKLKKQWLATLDGRTRHSHAMLDGETQDTDKKFSNGCMYPGDPNGRAEEVYNCRCTLIASIDGEKYEDAQRRARDPTTGKNAVIADMTYAEWARWKQDEEDKEQYEDYLSILGEQIVGEFSNFKNVKYNNQEKWMYWGLDKKRQDYLIANPDMILPGGNYEIPNPKFTEYLFNPENKIGFAKGKAITQRLGYSIENWTELKNEVETKVLKYAATQKRTIEQGITYEQRMVLYGKNDTPANVVVAWINKNDNSTSMTSLYIKEIRE